MTGVGTLVIQGCNSSTRLSSQAQLQGKRVCKSHLQAWDYVMQRATCEASTILLSSEAMPELILYTAPWNRSHVQYVLRSTIYRGSRVFSRGCGEVTPRLAGVHEPGARRRDAI